MDRIDAINELYALGRDAEKKLAELTEAQARATICRLNGWLVMAGQANTDAALLFRELESIGNRQVALIDQLNAAEEIIRL